MNEKVVNNEVIASDISNIFLSTKTFTGEKPMVEIDMNDKNYALCYHGSVDKFCYNLIETVNKVVSKEPYYRLTFIDGKEKEYIVYADRTQKFFTANGGYLSLRDIDKYQDCFITYEGNYCKLKTVKRLYGDHEKHQITISYLNNYFCNGILIKGHYHSEQ